MSASWSIELPFMVLDDVMTLAEHVRYYRKRPATLDEGATAKPATYKNPVDLAALLARMIERCCKPRSRCFKMQVLRDMLPNVAKSIAQGLAGTECGMLLNYTNAQTTLNLSFANGHELQTDVRPIKAGVDDDTIPRLKFDDPTKLREQMERVVIESAV